MSEADRLAPRLGYAGLTLDRLDARRNDAAFLEAEAGHSSARTVAFSGDALLTKASDAGVDMLFDAAALGSLGAIEPVAYLGRQDGAPRFAARLGDGADEAIERSDTFVLGDLKALASDGRLSGDALALAGYAKSLAAWHARHGFCANCGAATEPSASGWRRTCPSCGAMHFPRVDPVVIMLVTRGDDCLLGRQARFPPGMWSCLAGFVEPGETIEEAARREILEEAGVRLGEVSYELSQPWPFPSQLMLGVSAEALTETVTPDFSELEDARWFSREDVSRMFGRIEPGGPAVPPSAAIAHHLLMRFVDRS